MTKLFIWAASKYVADYVARAHGLHPVEWAFLTKLDQLRGLCNQIIWVVDSVSSECLPEEFYTEAKLRSNRIFHLKEEF